MQLINGDCLDVMQSMAPKSVDMVLCDLPYGTTKCDWDVEIPLPKFWLLLSIICKDNAAIVLFSKQPFTSKLVMSNVENFRQELIWQKDNHDNPMMAKKRHLNITENILVFYKSQPTYNPQGIIEKNTVTKQGRGQSLSQANARKPEYIQTHTNYPRNILQFKRDLPNVHPTQKPVKLLEYLIKTYSNPNDVVFDPTMGSGSTAVAAENTGRNFIGVELDDNYYNVAFNRVFGANGHNNPLQPPTSSL